MRPGVTRRLEGLCLHHKTLTSLDSRCGEHHRMVKTAKMELLRALVSECLSAAAQEIFKIVERTILEYEEEMSCSKWVVDNHRRLLDVAKSHSEGQFVTGLLSTKEIVMYCISNKKKKTQMSEV